MLSSSARFLLQRQHNNAIVKQSLGLSSSDRHQMTTTKKNFSTKSPSDNNNSQTNNSNNNVTPIKKESVHPLSQLVLEYLQCNRAEWVKERGLHDGLKIHANGTILMKFPQGRVWTSFDHTYKQHWLMVRMNTTENEHDNDGNGNDDKDKNKNKQQAVQQQQQHTGNSSTTELMRRFLLQDNLRPAWNDGHSTPEKVQKAVEDMISKMDDLLDKGGNINKNAAEAKTTKNGELLCSKIDSEDNGNGPKDKS